MNKKITPHFLFLLLAFATVVYSADEIRTESLFCSIIIFLYFFLYFIKIKLYKYLNNVCGFIVFILTFVRYFLIPLLIISDDGYMSYKPMDSAANGVFFVQGAVMTIWEMLFCGWFIYRKFPKWYGQERIRHQEFETPAFLWLLMNIVFGVLIFVNLSVLNEFTIVVNLKPDDSVFEESVHKSLTETVAIIGARVVKIILPIPILCVLYKRYNRHHSYTPYFMGLVLLLFFYAFILEGNSRNSIIIPAVAALFILYTLFPRYSKSTYILIIPAIALVAVLSSVWKSFSGDFVLASISPFTYWISYLEMYFAGISNIGKAVYGYQHTDVIINPIMALNDMGQTIPFVNVLVDYQNTSSYVFQRVWGRSDQVIPALGNGLFYFGYVFAPLVSVVFISIAHYFEKLKNNARGLPEFIIYCYACAIVSYNIYNSIHTMMMKLTITILPLMFAVYLANCVNRKKRNGTSNVY